MNIPALQAPSALHGAAVLGGARDWTWRDVHAAALVLAARLEPGAPVCNLCTTRVGFLVAWLAALRRGCLQLLPPSGGNADLGALLAATPGTTVVIEDATQLPPLVAGAARIVVHQPEVPATLPADDALAWTPDWDRDCVCLYTSGTTGAPQAHHKSLRQLVAGAHALAARLDEVITGGLAACRAIVCSVPPQHMFGFETSVLLSWVTQLPVFDRRPLLPLDVRAALTDVGVPALWVATPLHLRALAQSGETLPNCRLALVSTMPLAPALAAQVEPLVQAPVVEIYGSTETGALATRRTASDSHWQPVGDVRLESSDAATQAWGAHFPSPTALSDGLELGADGHFALLGRHADVVKIGGRRASLAGLNLLLQELPGLQDGVFFLPASDSPVERLALVHAGAIDRAAAEQWLRARMDPVFLPRTWVQVDRLPRDANGKLPRAALQALHAAHEGGALQFDFRVPAGHPALPGHFPGRPIVPGVLVLDHVLHWLRQRTGRAVARLPRAKFSAPLLPDETAHVRFTPRGEAFAFRVSVQRAGAARVIAEGTLVLEPRA